MAATVDDVTLPDSPIIEHRLGRFDLDAPVQLATQDGTTLAVARNVSIGGMFVELPRVQAPGRRVVVRLSVPREGVLVEVGAEVRWSRAVSESAHRPTGMGLRFTVPIREATTFVRILLRRCRRG